MKADVIHNTTTTKYSLVDLLKLMIGGKSVTNLEIETSNEVVDVLKTTARTHVQYPDWINRIRFRKQKGYGEILETKQ